MIDQTTSSVLLDRQNGRKPSSIEGRDGLKIQIQQATSPKTRTPKASKEDTLLKNALDPNLYYNFTSFKPDNTTTAAKSHNINQPFNIQGIAPSHETGAKINQQERYQELNENKKSTIKPKGSFFDKFSQELNGDFIFRAPTECPIFEKEFLAFLDSESPLSPSNGRSKASGFSLSANQLGLLMPCLADVRTTQFIEESDQTAVNACNENTQVKRQSTKHFDKSILYGEGKFLLGILSKYILLFSIDKTSLNKIKNDETYCLETLASRVTLQAVLNVEFAQLHLQKIKREFTLTQRGFTHEFTILAAIKTPQLLCTLSAHQLLQPELIRCVLKAWVSLFNDWVVRSESLKRYEILKELGVGGQGRVFKIQKRKANNSGMRQENGPDNSILNEGLIGQGKQGGQQSMGVLSEQKSEQKLFAIKVVKKLSILQKSEYHQLQMLMEIRIQRELNMCGNTVKLVKLYETDKYLNILMEYQQGGSLGDMLTKQVPFKEDSIRIVMAQLLLSIDFMSRKNIIHRDIKPENILINQSTGSNLDIRIADFGFALDLSNTLQVQYSRPFMCGTPGFVAPEIANQQHYGLKADIFSAGSILFSLLTGRNLFDGSLPGGIMRQNKECKTSECISYLKKTGCCSRQARKLTAFLLEKDYTSRPSAQDALMHPWFEEMQDALIGSFKMNQLLVRVPGGGSPWQIIQKELIQREKRFQSNNSKVRLSSNLGKDLLSSHEWKSLGRQNNNNFEQAKDNNSSFQYQQQLGNFQDVRKMMLTNGSKINLRLKGHAQQFLPSEGKFANALDLYNSMPAKDGEDTMRNAAQKKSLDGNMQGSQAILHGSHVKQTNTFSQFLNNNRVERNSESPFNYLKIISDFNERSNSMNGSNHNHNSFNQKQKNLCGSEPRMNVLHEFLFGGGQVVNSNIDLQIGGGGAIYPPKQRNTDINRGTQFAALTPKIANRKSGGASINFGIQNWQSNANIVSPSNTNGPKNGIRLSNKQEDKMFILNNQQINQPIFRENLAIKRLDSKKRALQNRKSLGNGQEIDTAIQNGGFLSLGHQQRQRILEQVIVPTDQTLQNSSKNLNTYRTKEDTEQGNTNNPKSFHQEKKKRYRPLKDLSSISPNQKKQAHDESISPQIKNKNNRPNSTQQNLPQSSLKEPVLQSSAQIEGGAFDVALVQPTFGRQLFQQLSIESEQGVDLVEQNSLIGVESNELESCTIVPRESGGMGYICKVFPIPLKAKVDTKQTDKSHVDSSRGFQLMANLNVPRTNRLFL
ncbi:hypothetical protein FGO68_gene16745 [Halteria grandinella]|uniref:Protein kinase domain-containing protein n=1 Tax=Halteria grandinella TaxID=5974 RepID=A0A8J8P0T6_HALGN|nr:hypothetical protein FGO68_gene16745 [Halteria grandinella]